MNSSIHNSHQFEYIRDLQSLQSTIHLCSHVGCSSLSSSLSFSLYKFPFIESEKMNIFEPEERIRINLKLIELVKPHEALYNSRKGDWRHFSTQSFNLWTDITTLMNDFFKMDWSECYLMGLLRFTINQILLHETRYGGMEGPMAYAAQ